MEILPNDDDWACFLDHDAMFTTTNWYNQLNELISSNSEIGAFGAMTNRVGYPPQLVGNIDLMSNDIEYHRNVGEHLYKNHYSELFFPKETTHYSGVFILLKKKTWKEINGFSEDGFLRVDNDFRLRLHKNKIKFAIARGVYVYHWYRFSDKYHEEESSDGHLGDRPYERLEILQKQYAEKKDELTLNDIFFFTEPWWTLKKKYKMIEQIPAYCLYMKDRENYIKNFFNGLNLDISFILGIDKNQININAMIDQEKIIKWPRLNEGRVACHLGHIKILETFLKSNKERCIIFEDDLCTSYEKDKINKHLENIFHNLPEDCDVLFLGYCHENCEEIVVENEYISRADDPRCRHAYSVNRHAAETIIHETSTMSENGDLMMGWLFQKNKLKAYLANHVMFEQNRHELGSKLGNVAAHSHCSELK